MKKNMGKTDKIIRLSLAAVFALLLLTGTIALVSTLGVILIIIAVIFALTSLVNWCPLYSLFGASTCAVKSSNN